MYVSDDDVLANLPLAKRQRYERLSAYLRTLSQFRYGYERLMLEPGGPASVSKEFYYNSLVRYLYAIYLANGAAARFYEFLRDYGLSDHVDRIEALFGRQVGPKTFRERLLDVRGSLLDHYDFSGERVRALKAEYDAENNRKAYGVAMDEILALTHRIAVIFAEYIDEQKRGASPT